MQARFLHYVRSELNIEIASVSPLHLFLSYVIIFSDLVDSIVPAARKDVAFSNVSYVATSSYP